MELRFGISVPTSASRGSDPIAFAREAESLGFDLVTVSDHLHGTHPTFETWTLLTWIAASTSRVTVAPTVLGLPYRWPSVVAKMAESLDRLSGGRLILGLGGGGSDDEFRGFGVPVRTPREKVEALAEAIEVIRGLWSQPSLSYRGRHFVLEGAELEPKPDRHIPIWTGSYGPRSLAVTGRLADGWNPSYPYLPPEAAVRARDILLRAAAEAGRDPDALTCAYNVPVYVDEKAQPNPRMVTGGSDEVAERLAELVRLGFGTLIFWVRGGEESRHRLAQEVIPAVRSIL